MLMHDDWSAAIIANDLDSMALRIEALPGHPRYTDALCAVQKAKAAIMDGRACIHQREMSSRHDGRFSITTITGGEPI